MLELLGEYDNHYVASDTASAPDQFDFRALSKIRGRSVRRTDCSDVCVSPFIADAVLLEQNRNLGFHRQMHHVLTGSNSQSEGKKQITESVEEQLYFRQIPEIISALHCIDKGIDNNGFLTWSSIINAASRSTIGTQRF
jgi:hypothetical protein